MNDQVFEVLGLVRCQTVLPFGPGVYYELGMRYYKSGLRKGYEWVKEVR